MRISDWSSDVCSSDLRPCGRRQHRLDLQAYRLTASRESPYFPLPRHAELVSASMARDLVKRGVIFEDRPWTLKQVQGDEEVSMERLSLNIAQRRSRASGDRHPLPRHPRPPPHTQ